MGAEQDLIEYITSVIHTLIGGNEAVGMTVFDLMRVIATIIGFGILFLAIIRLSKHGKAQQMFRYYAPSTTILMFISGVLLLSIGGFLEVLTAVLFQDENLNPVNAMTSYVDVINDDVNVAQQHLVFSLLALVGFASLIRGIFLLVKISEGQHEGGVGQIISHIIAGVIGMNAAACVNILNNIYTP